MIDLFVLGLQLINSWKTILALAVAILYWAGLVSLKKLFNLRLQIINAWSTLLALALSV